MSALVGRQTDDTKQFLGPGGSNAVSSVRDQLFLAVETVHHAAGKLTFGTAPVKQQRPVRAQHSGHSFHPFDLQARGLRAPAIEELPRPMWQDMDQKVCNFTDSQAKRERYSLVSNLDNIHGALRCRHA